MSTALPRWLVRYATGRNILLLLAGYMLFNGALLPLAKTRLEALAGGVGPLDLRFHYSAAEAYQALAAYGPAGRPFYLLLEVTLDVVYPLTYTLFFGLTILYGFGLAGWEQRLGPVVWLPVAALLADFAENACLALLLLNFPHQFLGLAALAGWITSLKWVLASLTLAAVLAAVGAAFWSRRQRPAVPPRA